MRGEYHLAGYEGDEGEADLLHCHAQRLVSLVYTADMDQEVTHPTQAQHEVQDKLINMKNVLGVLFNFKRVLRAMFNKRRESPE